MSIRAGSVSELSSRLQDTARKAFHISKVPRLGFVFNGQGAQWHAMGREVRTYARFKESLEAADVYISSLGSTWSVVEELGREEASSRINEPHLSQPLCTVVQIAYIAPKNSSNSHRRISYYSPSSSVVLLSTAPYTIRRDYDTRNTCLCSCLYCMQG